MKSEPGCSMIFPGASEARPPPVVGASRSSAALDGMGAVAFAPRCAVCWAFAGWGLATSAAAPAAAPFKKLRRATEVFLDFAIAQSSWIVSKYSTAEGVGQAFRREAHLSE